MQPLVESAAAVLASIAERRAAWRREQIARYGWPEDVTCVACGDTGEPPTGFALCTCGAGERLALRRRRQSQWAERIPSGMRGWTLRSAPDQAAAQEMSRWLTDAIAAPRRAANVMIYGRPGSGKTGLAIGALAGLCFAGVDIGFVVASDWLDEQRPGAGPEGSAAAAMRRAQTVTVLALDDLGAERATDWTLERLYLLLNHRMNEGRPTLVTSNLTLDGLTALVGDRIRRRLTRDETAVEVVVGGG